MKSYKLIYIFIALLGLSITSCEDDEPISAGVGSPFSKTVVNIDATLTADTETVGEGTASGFTVTLPQALASDATITARLTFDNGGSTTGQVEIAAGETTGTGSITSPADDGAVGEDGIFGIADSAQLELVAILLDELVPGTTYTISSNLVSLGIFGTTGDIEPSGLNLFLDWDGAPANDIDLFAIDAGFTNFFADSQTLDRYEEALFESASNPDGVYDVYTIIYTPIPPEGLNYALQMILPDGTLKVVTGTIPATAPLGFPNFVSLGGSFEKSTNAETGEISYINVGSSI